MSQPEQGPALPSPVPGPAPPAPPAPPGSNPLAAGWGTAVVRAAVAAATLAVLAEGLAFLLYAAASGPKPSKALVARVGGALFYTFHRVGLVVEVPRSALSGELGAASPIPLPVSLRATATLALMGGTVLVIWLLESGGRAVANGSGGTSWVRGVHGAKISLPYALICLAGAWAVRFAAPVGAGKIEVHPSYVAALLWPLGLGMVAGFLGGVRSRRALGWEDAEAPPDRSMLQMRAVVAGGWWMISLALLLSFAGLVMLAAVKPDATRAYFNGAFQGGVDNGAAVIAANLLVVPNMAAWVLFPAMGSCLGVSGASLGLNGSFCLLSYTRFPTGRAVGGLVGGAAGGGLPKPPVGYFAFILAPALAVVIGGMVAARISKAEQRTDAIGAGALAGFAFGLMATLALVLSIITLKAGGRIGGASQAITLRLGPDLTKSILLAFLWGIVGGAIGGLIQARTLPRDSAGDQPALPG